MDEPSFLRQVEAELVLEEDELDLPEELEQHAVNELDYFYTRPEALEVLKKAYDGFKQLGMKNSTGEVWDTTVLAHYRNHYTEFQQKEIHNTVDRVGRRVKPDEESGDINYPIEGALLKSLVSMNLASNQTNNTTARMGYEVEDYAAVARVFNYLDSEWNSS